MVFSKVVRLLGYLFSLCTLFSVLEIIPLSENHSAPQEQQLRTSQTTGFYYAI